MSYRVETLDLSAVQEKKEIVGRDTAVKSWTVTSLPGGAAVQLHIGQNGDPVDLKVEGMGGEPDEGECFITTEGLFFSCPAQPGISVKLYIAFGGGASGGRLTR